jgi:putative ABC transport system permease protein
MAVLARVRGHAGLWGMVGLLGGAMVFLAAAAGPVTTRNEDRALRQMIETAPYRTRDITVVQRDSGRAEPTDLAGLRSELLAVLPDELSDLVDRTWTYRRTTISPRQSGPSIGASITGAGIRTEPDGMAPVISVHHQLDLADEIEIVTGRAPFTDPGGALEVMTTAAVAEALGLTVGQEYDLWPGVVGVPPREMAPRGAPPFPLLLTGMFAPRDAGDAAWEHTTSVLRPSYLGLPTGQPTRALRATFVTDETGFDLVSTELNFVLAPESALRARLDAGRMRNDTATTAWAALDRLRVDPRLEGRSVQTRLDERFGEFQAQAAAMRAQVAVVAAGLIGTGAGLLVLVARLAVDRRRGELVLLRARGASVPAVIGRFTAEAAVLVVPAVAAGWLLHRLPPGRPDPGAWTAPWGVADVVRDIGELPLLAAAVALLVVPVTVGLALPGLGTGAAGGRREAGRPRSSPVRLTAELVVVLLAGLGVLLLHQRGLTPAPVDPPTGPLGGPPAPARVDPYLSAVPVLIGVGAGLVALRIYPWPVRALGALAGRRRGAVGFLGLTRAGRAAPAAALPLVVLVLAVAVGGFAGTVYSSVERARGQAAILAVGAHARLAAAGMSETAVGAVRDSPDVEAAAAVTEVGVARPGLRPAQGAVAVDAAAYQEVLAAIGAPVRLPEGFLSARAGADPLPVLAEPDLAGRTDITIRYAGEDHPAVVVGDATLLPGPYGDGDTVLVPRRAMPGLGHVDEVLVGGEAADLDAARAAIAVATGEPAEAVTVTSVAQHVAEQEASGFNRALILMLVVGTAGAALGGLLAVALALVVQAAVRGRALSLLRTMGLSQRQARGVLLVEMLPLITLAVAVGAVVGLALPVILGPALGLAQFTAGTPVVTAVDPRTVGALVALVAALAVGGVAVEAAVNRRTGLGRVLRVDSR